MTKILLVEDDKSLQEIYGVRLGSEGYSVLIAGDGEEALNVALKEKPDLILSDVMMPKISGFDMLDILRTTPEIKDTKVIIMTALSSEDQRERGEKLGANVYLVKSQVGIEDVVQAVKDLLEGKTETDKTAAYQEEINDAAQFENGSYSINTSPTKSDFQNATVQLKNTPNLQSQPDSTSGPTLAHDNSPQPAPITPATPQLSNSEVDEAIKTNGESLHHNHQPMDTQSDNPNINPQYRQPTSLRDLIPERDNLHGR